MKLVQCIRQVKAKGVTGKMDGKINVYFTRHGIAVLAGAKHDETVQGRSMMKLCCRPYSRQKHILSPLEVYTGSLLIKIPVIVLTVVCFGWYCHPSEKTKTYNL